ncbi:hypothetical protein SNOG_13107 [Parastagonospora nodorum SN15]|uniref:Uncharacterized protein n=1 Tax=Phaeosphaeria nodorum (strain SN15 / ATCC MYA-4574 / FGSC 10173) TaxID=321614 RepID=Q0U557_PHANO|nr:hypothetical protein SNOG_13107 [Parastagonospora nodorum SN15]EAT79434.1 hypothetical protein SNOG_13107 [Parastagonospora nodorum SN15]
MCPCASNAFQLQDMQFMASATISHARGEVQAAFRQTFARIIVGRILPLLLRHVASDNSPVGWIHLPLDEALLFADLRHFPAPRDSQSRVVGHRQFPIKAHATWRTPKELFTPMPWELGSSAQLSCRQSSSRKVTSLVTAARHIEFRGKKPTKYRR